MRTSALITVSLISSTSAMATSPYRVDYALDGTLAGGAFLGGALFMLIPVDRTTRWDQEMFPFDDVVKANFSAKSSALSDGLILLTTLTPLAAQLGGGFNETLGQAALLYGEALGAGFLLNAASKYLVQRPRPYVYNTDPNVVAFAQTQSDSHVSFYSGHSSMSFTAAVAGSMLFAATSTDRNARAALWAVELALATATANLRVRAGKHFYSDVIIGSLVGIAVGFAVPYSHQRPGSRYTPTTREWGAMAGGVVVGAVASQLLPLPSDIQLPLTPTDDQSARAQLLPLALPHGAGLQLSLYY